MVRVSLSNTVVDDAWLRRLGCLRELRLLWLDGATVTDGGLRVVGRSMPHLEILVLNETQVTNAGLAELAGFARLRGLFLGEQASRTQG